MAQNYRNKSGLKNLLFYNEEIESSEKNNKKISNIGFLSELSFFDKKPKQLSNIQLSKELLFPPKNTKKPKRSTKHQILQNVLAFFDTVGISRREYAHKYYAETYDVDYR